MNDSTLSNKRVAEKFYSSSISCYRNRDYSNGLDLIQESIDVFKLNKALYLKSMIYYDLRMYKTALDVVEKICDDDNNDIDVLLMKGKCLMKMKLYKEAIEVFDVIKCNENKIKSSQVFYYKGLVYIKLKKFSKANTMFVKSLHEYNEKNEIAHLGFGLIEYKKGKYKKALNTLNKSIETNKKSNDLAFYYRGKVFMKLKKFAKAHQNFIIANKINPFLIKCYHHRIRICKKEDLKNEKKIAIKHMLSYGQQLVRQEKIDNETISVFDKILEMDKSHSSAYYFRSLIFIQGVQFKKSINCLLKSLEYCNEKKKNSYLLLNDLAYSYFYLRKYEKSLKYFNQASEKNSIMLYRMGNLFYETNFFNRAFESYERSVELDEYTLKSTFQLGILSLIKNEYENAEKKYFRAIIDSLKKEEELIPSSIVLNGVIRWITDRLHIEKVTTEFSFALSYYPDLIEAYFNRAIVLEREEEYNHSIDDYSRMVEICQKYLKILDDLNYDSKNLFVARRYEVIDLNLPFSIRRYGITKEDRIKILKEYLKIAYQKRGYLYKLVKKFDNAIDDFRNCSDLLLDKEELLTQIDFIKDTRFDSSYEYKKGNKKIAFLFGNYEYNELDNLDKDNCKENLKQLEIFFKKNNFDVCDVFENLSYSNFHEHFQKFLDKRKMLLINNESSEILCVFYYYGKCFSSISDLIPVDLERIYLDRKYKKRKNLKDKTISFSFIKKELSSSVRSTNLFLFNSFDNLKINFFMNVQLNIDNLIRIPLNNLVLKSIDDTGFSKDIITKYLSNIDFDNCTFFMKKLISLLHREIYYY